MTNTYKDTCTVYTAMQGYTCAHEFMCVKHQGSCMHVLMCMCLYVCVCVCVRVCAAESEQAVACELAEAQARAVRLPTNLATCAITCKLPCITEQEETEQPTSSPKGAEEPDTQTETTSHSDKDTTASAHAADATDAITFGACGTEAESDHVASSSPSQSGHVSACAEVRVKVCVPEAKAPVVSPPSPTKSRRGWRVLFSCILPQRD